MARPFRRIVMWFRRDLRVADNEALLAACRDGDEVIPFFVIDDDVRTAPSSGAARVAFLLDALVHLDRRLGLVGGRLIVRRGIATQELPAALAHWKADALYFNRAYEPCAGARDSEVEADCKNLGVACRSFKDLVLQEPNEIATQTGKPYTVFGAYQRTWLNIPVAPPKQAPVHVNVPSDIQSEDVPTAESLSVGSTQVFQMGGEEAANTLLIEFADSKLTNYAEHRDLPSVDGTSLLSRHLHCGTISPRTVFAAVRKREGAPTFVSELCWRDFFVQLLHHHPYVEHGSFKPSLTNIKWENDEAHFDAWKAGRTGYPIVDAAMRQLNSEAWMHNRCRMIVASFLAKDLLIDWRWGEAYFMRQLVDADLAANNGGWQWSAGTGADAQPYFRVFNPVAQGEKFDRSGEYVRRYVPELKAVPDKFIHRPWAMPDVLQNHLGCRIGREYPAPIVDHAVRRELAIATYRVAEVAKQ